MPRIVVLLLILSSPAFPAGRPTNQELAEHYAPVIYQEAHSEVLDFITRFDFDGDWDGSNNWRNAYSFDLNAYVYYGVIETTRQYFITYAFFHPRDYTAQPMEGYAPKMEHENDMEGCTLLVKKDKSRWGVPLVLETLAHDHFYVYTNSSVRDVAPRNVQPSGSIVFVPRSPGAGDEVPAVFVEAEGHGVRGAGDEILRDGFEHPGIIYRLDGRGSELPESNRDQDVSYQLVAIESSLWPRRHDVGESSTYCCGADYSLAEGGYARWGDSFNGPIGGCAARPPWGWDQANDGPIEKGDWFRDPARTFGYQLNIGGLGGGYLHNPYLEEPDPVAGIPRCSGATTSSRTVKESVIGALLGIGTEILSGGLNREDIKSRASALFLGGATLLEWSPSNIRNNWVGVEAQPATEPSTASPSARNETARRRDDLLQLSTTFSISSPPLRAPARYFDRLAMLYRCSGADRNLQASWLTDAMETFDSDHSVPVTLQCSGEWKAQSVALDSSIAWDKESSIVQFRLEEKTESPSGGSAQPSDAVAPIEIRYVVLDRRAFADTFVR